MHPILARARRVAAAILAVVLAGALGQCGPRRDRSELAIGIPTEVPRGLQLNWERVSGADSYRLVFSRMSGTPVCTLMVGAMSKPAFLIQRDSLPAGLAHRWELLLEIQAMRHGKPMPAAGQRPLKTP